MDCEPVNFHCWRLYTPVADLKAGRNTSHERYPIFRDFLEKVFPINREEKQMSIPSLLDAVRVVKENERKASASYADAAHKISDLMGKQLFQQLSEFERFHYEQLTALETSLEASGDFINYEGKEFPTPPLFEIKAAQEPDTKSVMTIISEAIDLEKQAEKAYADLSAQTTDPRGYKMFSRLSEEEHNHYRLLSDAYWTLNNLGTWTWSRP
jgi:rubrerythrin